MNDFGIIDYLPSTEHITKYLPSNQQLIDYLPSKDQIVGGFSKVFKLSTYAAKKSYITALILQSETTIENIENILKECKNDPILRLQKETENLKKLKDYERSLEREYKSPSKRSPLPEQGTKVKQGSPKGSSIKQGSPLKPKQGSPIKPKQGSPIKIKQGSPIKTKTKQKSPPKSRKPKKSSPKKGKTPTRKSTRVAKKTTKLSY